ncbi:MAG: hypothetical protein ACI8UR_001611 [Natronomonas sp.]|jgi:hypothetical protein|uniref:hypothetical protein n=1 Tax=Natronomonas sp. TaxID=2184060 RepID=UPI003988E59C
MASDGNVFERIGEYMQEHRGGMVTDLVFALAWVTIVTVLFNLVDGPQWAYYLFMLSGVVAYYGFVFSLDMAKEQQGKH